MYLDTAILLKLVVREPDSGFYVERLDGRTDLWASELCRTECLSALCRKEREGHLSAAVRREAWKRIEAFFDEGMVALVPLNSLVLRGANRAIEACAPGIPLRTLDALHLASCEHAAAWPLWTNDRVLRAAAERLAFPLGPVPAGAGAKRATS